MPDNIEFIREMKWKNGLNPVIVRIWTGHGSLTILGKGEANGRRNFGECLQGI